MRLVFTILCFLAALGLGCSKERDWSKRIVSKKERPIASFINPHVSTINVLIIDGKRFDHVRGLERFYLPITPIDAILFVIDEKDYSVTYHVVKMNTGEDIAIHARDSVFGQTIGSGSPMDAVESTGHDKLTLSTRSGPRVITKTLIELDLVKRAVITEKTYFYDKDGNVSREHDDGVVPPTP